jgi:hypothetical protein
LPSWFAKLSEANFSCFAKIIWMPSWFAKLLELLLNWLLFGYFFLNMLFRMKKMYFPSFKL